MITEIIVTNSEEAKLAQSFGSNRLELINSVAFGGLSPVLNITKEVCESVDIPVNIMLRNNSSEKFIYSKYDMDNMLQELEFIRLYTKANGIVFGALDRFGNIDMTALEIVIANKGHLKLTFHRAIDVATNIMSSYKQLLAIPQVDWVLTSGGAKIAIEGIDNIHKMVTMSQNHTNAQIIAASGITLENAPTIIKETGVQEIHIGTGVRLNNTLNQNLLKKLSSCMNMI